MTHKGQIVEIPATSPLYKREAPDFLSREEELIWRSSKIDYSLFDGFLVGEHSGVEHFKIGQRKGIKVGGKKEPLYVINIDEIDNRLFVGAGENHPGLWTTVLSFSENYFQRNQEISFNANERETGISIEVLSSVLEEKVSAKLYFFDQTAFLEFDQPTLIKVKENPICLYYQNTIIAENNK